VTTVKTSFLIFVLFATCAAQTRLCSSQTSDCRQDASGTKLGSGNAIELPIQLYRDYVVVVEGSIGNLEELTFIVDTGAYPSVIDQKIAIALGLKERDGEVAMVNRSVQTKLATLPLVAVGPVRVEDVPVRVQDLSSIEKTLGRRIDAVVGLDVLGTNSFSIDYRTKRLRFGPVRRTRSAVSFKTGDPFVIVEARLDDNPVRLLVDTGTSALVLFQSHLKRPISRFAGRTTTATDVGGGDYRLQPVLIPDTRLGRQELGPLTAFVVADQGDDTHDFDGLLSVRGLHLKEIGFDFENHEISWRK
jgi:predicted aspartyl protease